MTSYKVMLLGDIGVGKTSLVRRLMYGQFATDYGPTIGVDIYSYICDPDALAAAGQPPAAEGTELVIWDTDGNFGESIFRHAYIREASAAIIVGDATRRPTQDSMVRLADGFQDAFPGRTFAFVLNKCDMLEADVPPDLPEALASTHHLFIKTSAKTGDNVKLAFHDTAATILRRDF
ncbi:MAG: GTP-binding protein [Pseudomonadota bacterium]